MTLIIAAAFIAGAIVGMIAMGVLFAGKADALLRIERTAHKLLIGERDQVNSDLTGAIVEAEAEIDRLKPLAKRGEQAIASQLKASLASAEKRAKSIV
jgi:hypothetical protein